MSDMNHNYITFYLQLLYISKQNAYQSCILLNFNGCKIINNVFVLLRLRVQNRRTKWNFPLNFRTMRKLSELYSRIFQTQLSG